MESVDKALIAFAEILRDQNVRVLVDNSSTMWGMKKGQSKSEGVTLKLHQLLERKQRLNIVWSVN